ncbi:ATP-binding protein [Methyloversatilis thermotolerans]|uniref:ATP-binding protein n=1 Tax=Methyloversatilis thermotolerans TaxID=1346290 RepID=UPI00037E0343|nr:ATP-binding protein [Methyloversatilis thermotolerans]
MLIRSFFGPGGRFPLYTGLVATLAGCALAALLSLWGSIEIERQFEQVFGALVDSCTQSPANADHACEAFARVERTLLERVAVMLLLQGLCCALIVAGAVLIAQRAFRVLVRRTEAAMALMPDDVRTRGRDEIERLVDTLAEMTARQAGFEAEGRWRQQVSGEQLRRTGQSLQTLHRVARMFTDGDVSEFGLRGALSMLEGALGAQTAALCLNAPARQALGTDSALCTHGEPALLAQINPDGPVRDATARVVPASPECPHHTLLVPVCRGNVSVGALLLQFPDSARVDDLQAHLAESFAHLAALAISSVSRSQEERRVALIEERTAIAGELHDSLAQSLAYMKIQVAQLQRGLDREKHPTDVAQAARELREGLNAAYREVRELIAAFRVRMGAGGLLSTVQDTIDEFAQRSGLDMSFVHDLGRCHLEVNEEFHVMQVIREALSNTVRHARAYHVWVSMKYGPEHRLTVVIDDDGRGLTSPYAESNHYGLSIMRERARSLGGQVSVVHRPGGGTRVQLEFAPQKLPSELMSESPT